MQAFKSLNSIIRILLRTHCRRQKTQLLCNQASPNSFSKIPGVWVSRTGDTGRGTRVLAETGVPFSAASFIYAIRALLAPRDPRRSTHPARWPAETPTHNSSRGSYRPISAIGTRTFSLLRLGWIHHGTRFACSWRSFDRHRTFDC